MLTLVFDSQSTITTRFIAYLFANFELSTIFSYYY